MSNDSVNLPLDVHVWFLKQLGLPDIRCACLCMHEPCAVGDGVTLDKQGAIWKIPFHPLL